MVRTRVIRLRGVQGRNFVFGIPFILSESPNECWVHTCDACVITTWRLGLPAPLVAAKRVYRPLNVGQKKRCEMCRPRVKPVIEEALNQGTIPQLFSSEGPRKLISHFRVPPGLCIKARLTAQPLIWKWFFILMQIKQVVHLASFWKGGSLNSKVEYSERTHCPSPRAFVRLCFTVLGWGPPKCGDLSWLRFILSKQNITVATKEHIPILTEETNDKFKNLGFIKTLSPDRAPVKAHNCLFCARNFIYWSGNSNKRKEREISSTNVKRNQSLEQNILKKKADRALSKTNSILVYNFLFTVCN